MREIRFRAWDVSRKRMLSFDTWRFVLDFCDISGWNVRYNDNNLHQPWVCGDSASDFPMTLMQYTGIKDVRGREICEGDVVRSGKEIRIVEYLHGSFKPLDSYSAAEEDFIDPEIIGNVYEHPELWEGVK